MDRKTFEVLSFKKQLEYVNERAHVTIKEIADEIEGMPPSSLSQIFSQRGYRRVKGLYVKSEQKLQVNPSKENLGNPLQELLNYKDQLIAMVLSETKEKPKLLDFSFLEQFEGQTKKTITFDLPEEMIKDLDRFIINKGLKKQTLMSLIVYSFLESQK